MEKVLIINSPLFRYRNPLYDEDSLPPIGLGYIATALKQSNLSIELIDAVADNIPLEDLLKLVKDESPTVIALNIFTTNYELVKDFVESLDDESIYIIVGGLSTKALYEEIFTWRVRNKLDIVFGDGELITPDLVQKNVKEEPFIEKDNMCVFKVDANSIYYVANISTIPLDRSFFKNEPSRNLYGLMEVNIVTSRGCIYNCAFCAAARTLNKDFGIRERTFESITNELEKIRVDNPEVESVRILDDLFLKDKITIQKATDIFNNFNFRWRSMAHVMTFSGISEEMIFQLRQSGCSELFIGIESGSPRILKQIHKTHQIDLIKENLTNLLRGGINIKGYFIYGFPGETEDDFKMTLDLARYLKKYSLGEKARFRTSVFQFRPYHGTELYNDILIEDEATDPTYDIAANEQLSNLVGRRQHNFHSGNYATVDTKTVHRYIHLTTNLDVK